MRFLRLPCLLLLLALSPVQASETDIQARQTQIRAAYLQHFLQLVNWPDEAGATPETPWVICVSGRDPFGDLLDTLARRKIRGRPLKIRRLGDSRQFDACHLLYITQRPPAQIDDILDRTGTVLTVGDGRDFIARGGMIAFVNVADASDGGFRVRFEINLAAARQSGLQINAKLLELALRVVQ